MYMYTSKVRLLEHLFYCRALQTHFTLNFAPYDQFCSFICSYRASMAT